MVEYEVWIRDGRDGRCRECGYHPVKQGHAADCPERRKR